MPQAYADCFSKVLYKATGSQLNLPKEFEDFLWERKLKHLQLRGPTGSVIHCDLLIRKLPERRIKIGQGWKEFCRENDFGEGDEIVFDFDPGNENLMIVSKV